MDHFGRVRSVYEGTMLRHQSKSDSTVLTSLHIPRIPKGLTQEEGLFYEGLIQIVKDRETQFKKDGIDRKPHIVAITDLAKD